MKYEIRNTKYDSQATSIEHRASRHAFTLIELVVAIGLLSIVLVFSGAIFKVSIGSYRTASAQAEIMRKLRVITEQLDSDFKGLRKDAPMFIWFQQHSTDPSQRFDQIMFFADGDFQATKNPIIGNVARIQYGQAMIYSPSQLGYVYPWQQLANDVSAAVNYDRIRTIRQRTLARRQHIFSFDLAPMFPSFNAGNLLIDPNLNNLLEHDSSSLSQWQAATQNPITNNLSTQEIIVKCFGDTPDYSNHRPQISLADAGTLHLLMAEGAGSFSVQWSYFDPSGLRYLWWPSNDPDGDGNPADSDFRVLSPVGMGSDMFGFYFNVSEPPAPVNTAWLSYEGAAGPYYPNPVNPADKPSYPQALKFTFTLYDSRGVFRNGQTFTHIVYLGD